MLSLGACARARMGPAEKFPPAGPHPLTAKARGAAPHPQPGRLVPAGVPAHHPSEGAGLAGESHPPAR
eukprot:4422031-Pyramimonas_sp.AAC.1